MTAVHAEDEMGKHSPDCGCFDEPTQVIAPIPVAAAREYYEALCARYEVTPHAESHYRQGTGPDHQWPGVGPVLCEDFDQNGHWAVVWEGGPDEWVHYVPAQAGVFVEPAFVWALGLYPA